MALPKIKHITFSVTIPSTGKKEDFRPFTVQEEKIIVMASNEEDTDSKEVLKAIAQVINNCAISDTFQVEKLALFDIEWIFIQLRANSVNNIIEINKMEDDVLYTGTLDLKDVKVVKDKSHVNKVKVNDEIGVVLRYPSIAMINDLDGIDPKSMGFSAINYCIDKVYDADTVYTREENFTDEELDTFVSSLPSDALQEITKFFNTVPVIQADIVLATKDGKDTKVFTLKGINDFF